MIHASGSALEVHNIYGHEWAKMIFDNYQKFYPDQIPFILIRVVIRFSKVWDDSLVWRCQ